MAHPLGEAVLLVPGRDGAVPAQLDELESHLRARDVGTRRVPLGADPRATAEREIAGGTRLLVHCGGQAPLVRWLPAAVGGEAVVGVFPGGVPNDFARTFGLDTNPEAAAILVADPRVIRVDVGVARIGTTETYVFNHAVVGLGAEVERRRGRTRVGGLLAWYRAMARHRATAYDVDMTFAEYHAEAVQVRLANGQYAYGGLHAAPTALPDDGAWDVQVWVGPRTLPFTAQPAMLRGEHLPNEHVTQWRQKRAEVVATPPALVAVDDVVVGHTPATFEILPGALRLKI
jgi:diacylglycerol kinase (ATP)